MSAIDVLKEAGLDTARFLLPKSTERVLGIAEEEEEVDTSTGKLGPRTQTQTQKDTRKLTAEEKDIVQTEINPQLLKNEVKDSIRQDIQSGELNSEKIKNNAKNVVRQRINEIILQKVIPKERRSVGGFVDNFQEDLSEVVDGLGVILGLGIKAAINPIDTITKVSGNTKKLIVSPQYRQEVKNTYVDPIIDEYKEYRHPLTKLYEDPLDVLLDLSVVGSLGGTLAVKAGQKTLTSAAKARPTAQAISEARKTIKTSKDSAKVREASRIIENNRRLQQQEGVTKAMAQGKILRDVGTKTIDVSTPFKIRTLSATTKGVLKKMPGGEDIVKNMELRASTRKTLRKNQASFLSTRNKLLQDIDARVKKLTDAEVAALPRAAEGFALPPKNASRNFYEALGLMRALAKDQERFGLKVGAFTPEIIERRRFQPLANWLTKEGKLEKDPRIVKAEEALEKAEILGEGVGKARKELKKTQEKFGFQELTGEELRGQIATIKKFFPEADPIYMRHFFEDDPKKFANFFLNTKPARKFKPGFTRKSYGKDGYIGQNKITREQLKEVLNRQATENLKWQRNMALIEQFKKDPRTKKLSPGEKLLPGHAVFAPEGMLKFYRGTINISDEMRKLVDNIDDIEEIFADAVKKAFPDEDTIRNFVGVGKPQMYQVPQAMADELNKLVKSSNPYIKLFYDKPLDAFRFTALALFPRWQFNNAVGNIIFSTLQGDIFNPKAFYIYAQARGWHPIKTAKQKVTGKKQEGPTDLSGKKEAGALFPDELFGGIHQVERTTSGKLGSAVDVPIVRSTLHMHDKMMDTRVVGQLARAAEQSVVKGIFRPFVKVGNLSFRLNQGVDDMFKGVAFINRALKEERRGFLSRMTASFDDSLEALEKTTRGKKADAIVEDIHNWYYYGLNLTDFERRTIRRVIPFYSWLRWSSLYAFRIGTEAPVRANIIKNLSRDFYTFTGQNKLPEWMQGSVPIGTDEDGTVYYLTTNGLNPFGHINDFMSEGVTGTALRAFAPLPKTFMEQATGRDVFLGQKFTKEGLKESFAGDLYKFDPELGEVVKVEEKVKPALLENLLRNYIPQYIMMETILTGGKRRYTAEGLDEILKDLFRDPEERKAVVKDVITRQPEDRIRLSQEFGKAFGINIKEVEPKDEKARREALQKATSAIINEEIPMFNQDFKNLLKARIMEEVLDGTPKEEIAENIKAWIGFNIEKLKQLQR